MKFSTILILLIMIVAFSSCAEKVNLLDDVKTAAVISNCTGTVECGGAGDSCYDDAAATADGYAYTPSGKCLEYVTNSLSFDIWVEEDGTKVLQANGLDGWQKKLNADGRAHSATDFTSEDIVKGRKCPTHVFYDENGDGVASDFTNTGLCLYYSEPDAVRHRLDDGTGAAESSAATGTIWTDYLIPWNVAGSGNGTSASWYEGNIYSCNTLGMRLPAMYETTAIINCPNGYGNTGGGNNWRCEHLPLDSLTVTFASSTSNGIPTNAAGNWAWTASGYSDDTVKYWDWCVTATTSGGYDYNASATPDRVVCVLPQAEKFLRLEDDL